jgi:plastocyanin
VRGRPAVLALAAVAGAAVAVVPALAADQSVSTSGSAFVPRTVAVKPGEKVTWTNAGDGVHNVRFDDGTYTMPASPSSTWTVERTFNDVGSFRYHCQVHGAPNGSGMSGVVVVNAEGTVPTTTPAPTPTPTPTPTPSPTPSSTPPPGGSAPPPTAPPIPAATSFTVEPTRDHFCTRRGRTCRRPGVVLRYELEAPARVRIIAAVERSPLRGRARFRDFGDWRFFVTPGVHTIRASRITTRGRRFLPGRYRVTLRSGDGSLAEKTVRFRVRPS